VTTMLCDMCVRLALPQNICYVDSHQLFDTCEPGTAPAC
jgi:hypothetical protein